MKEFLTMDDFDFKGKTVLVRIDINCPVESGKVELSDRIIESAKTIKELSNKKAKIVILAHQGRKGDSDFIPLKQHAKLLSNYVKKKVEYIDDIIGEKAEKRIKSLKDGEILLLDNVRFLPDEDVDKPPEEHRKSSLVQKLSPLADVFVNDAFSAAHRSHASLVGFTKVLPSLLGRSFEREIKSIDTLINRMKISKHDTFVLGGAKPDEPLEIMKYMLSKGTLEKVLTCGVIGELFLLELKCNLGQTPMNFLKEDGYLEYLPQTKELLRKYKSNIEIPVDFAIEDNGKRKEVSIEELPVDSQILDIGTKTMEKYSEIIKKSVTVVMKGPTGMYERKGFDLGTKVVLNAIGNSKCISLVGGGHTLSAIDRLKINKNKFSHVSLGGGALITYLSGKKLPALEALRKNA